MDLSDSSSLVRRLTRVGVDTEPVSAYEPLPPPTGQRYQRDKAALRRCNLAAAIFHAISFIGAIIVGVIFLSGSAQTALTTDFTVYDAAAPGPVEAGPFSQQLRVLGYYQLIWLVEFEPLITCIFHAVIAGVPAVNEWYTRNTLVQGRNPIRWVEYSITASLMIWVIAQLSGLTNVVTLVLLVLGNIAMQFCGYLMEEMNLEPRLLKGKAVRWGATGVGWLLFVQQWTPVITYFFSAILSDRPPTVEAVPTFVYFVIFGLLLQFALFGLVQLGHYAGVGFLRSTKNYEYAMVALSFISKAFLTWTLLIGIATNQRS